MKRGLLIAGGVIGVLIAAVVGIGIYVYSSLEPLIQQAVETYGSEITQATVKLDEVELDASSGKGALRGLSIGNPEGFKTPTAFRLGAISVSLDTGTITEDIVVIREIVIATPDITYEIGSDGSNLDALQDNVNAYLESRGIGKGETGAGGAGDKGPKLVIENLYIRNGTVNVSATFLEGKTLSAPLPDIHLQDIGKDDGGASPGEVAEEVLASIKEGATGAVSGLGLDEMLGSVTEGVKGLTEGAGAAIGETLQSVTGGGAADSVGEALEGAGGAAGESAESLGSSIGEGAEEAGAALKSLFGN